MATARAQNGDLYTEHLDELESDGKEVIEARAVLILDWKQMRRQKSWTKQKQMCSVIGRPPLTQCGLSECE